MPVCTVIATAMIPVCMPVCTVIATAMIPVCHRKGSPSNQIIILHEMRSLVIWFLCVSWASCNIWIVMRSECPSFDSLCWREWLSNVLGVSVSGGKMARLENALYIIQGEVNLLVTAMRRNSRWLSSNIHQVVRAICIIVLMLFSVKSLHLK